MPARVVVALLLALLAGAVPAPGQAAVSERICLLQIEVDFAACAAAEDAVAACLNAVAARPNDFNARASLCEAYAAGGDFAAAIATMNDGKAIHRGDAFTLRLIDRVLSNVTEAQSAGDGPGPSVGTLVDYMVLRCTMIKSLQNCDEALKIDPDNVQALNGRGDILAAEGDIAGAVGAYRRSLAALPAQGEVTTKLDALLDARRQQVADCLAASSTAGIASCRAVLIAGETDAYDILRKIGSLELEAGALDRALDAFADADASRSSSESQATLAVLTLARECIDSAAREVCSRAVARVPQNALYRRTRAAVTLAGCRALATPATSASPAALEVCTEARTLNASRESVDLLERLLATLQTPPAADPATDQPPPVAALTNQCLALVAEGAATAEALAVCERAARDESVTATPRVLAALETLRVTRGNEQASSECRSAADRETPEAAIAVCRRLLASATDATLRAALETTLDGLQFTQLASQCGREADSADTLAVCRNALALAPDDAARLPVQQRIAQLERQLAGAAQLATLRERCLNFSSTSLGVAMANCRSAQEQIPDDPDIQRAMRTVDSLIAAYRNDPVRLTRGIEAVTY